MEKKSNMRSSRDRFSVASDYEHKSTLISNNEWREK